MAQGDLGTVASVRAGTNHTCVWVAGNDLRCFGRNNNDQLTGVTGGPGESATPLAVTW
jgi:hypothetical protein